MRSLTPSPWLFVLCLAVSLGASAREAVAQQTPAGGLAPLVTRQGAFSIPFNISSPQETAAIELHISTDGGAAWNFYDRRNPDEQGFRFQAPRDGHYWFASRTIDRRGLARPQRIARPELYVIVDTTAPQAELVVRRGDDRLAHATWRLHDEALVASSLRLEYQAAGATSWSPISIDIPTGHAPDAPLVGGASWRLDDIRPPVRVRLQVSDAAGNEATVERTLTDERVAHAAEPPRGDNRPAPHVDAGSGAHVVDAPQARSPIAGAAANPTPNASAPIASTPAAGSPAANAPTTVGVAGAVAPPVANRDESRPAGNRSPWAPPADDAPPPPAGVVGGAAAATAAAQEPSPPRTEEPPPSLPEGEQPQRINTKQFQLEYDLQSVGPQGAAKVELWGTADLGRTWRLWAEDEDRQSPLTAEVAGEGVFGFRIVVQGANGLSGAPPRDGDAADLWIEVDVTPPTGRLTEARYGVGELAGHLEISWEASDQQLAARPITLLFGTNPAGPWTPLAAGLANTGYHAWRVEAHTPDEAYLRLEVRDAAGNLTTHTTEGPVRLTPLIPQGRIRGIKPVGEVRVGEARGSVIVR